MLLLAEHSVIMHIGGRNTASFACSVQRKERETSRVMKI